MPYTVTDFGVTNNKKIESLPFFQKKFEEQIYCVYFSPFEWSQELLCVAFLNKICLAQVKFTDDDLDFQIIGEFNHSVRCSSIAISPSTSLITLPKVIQFCTAGADFKLRIYNSNLLDENTCQELVGHSDYVNDISFDTEQSFLASVSDDHTARIWDTSGTCQAVFYLTSAGVSVCWHNEDSAKLMVCEKNGLIRFYNIHTQQPILSLENSSPVSYAHWSPADSQLVGAMQQGELVLWDMTRPSRPAHKKVIQNENDLYISFSPFGDVVGTVSALSSCLKVLQLHNGQIKLNVPVKIPTRLTWHFRLPILCIGDDRSLCFWKVNTQ